MFRNVPKKRKCLAFFVFSYVAGWRVRGVLYMLSLSCCCFLLGGGRGPLHVACELWRGTGEESPYILILNCGREGDGVVPHRVIVSVGRKCVCGGRGYILEV